MHSFLWDGLGGVDNLDVADDTDEGEVTEESLVDGDAYPAYSFLHCSNSSIKVVC